MFKDKVVLVTGGASGIGRSTCIGFAKEGARVIVLDIDYSGAKLTCEEIHNAALKGSGEPFGIDLSNTKEIASVVTEIANRYNNIDILVNSAGVCQEKPLEELTDQDWHLIINTNLKGVFFLCQQVIKEMKRHNFGKIVNIASDAGESGGVVSSAFYGISKAGVICLTKILAKNVAGNGINVNTISPGLIITPMTENMRNNPRLHPDVWIPVKRYGLPEEVASLIMYLCTDEASYITGANIDINGGILMR